LDITVPSKTKVKFSVLRGSQACVSHQSRTINKINYKVTNPKLLIENGYKIIFNNLITLNNYINIVYIYMSSQVLTGLRISSAVSTLAFMITSIVVIAFQIQAASIPKSIPLTDKETLTKASDLNKNIMNSYIALLVTFLLSIALVGVTWYMADQSFEKVFKFE